MTTETLTKTPLHHGLRIAFTLLVIGALAAAGATTTSATTGAAPVSLTPRPASTILGHTARSWSYTWPVKPFDSQHPVRAFLNDPRISKKGVGAFHFGIDISAPDGTPVYAVEAGTVWFGSAQAIAVVSAGRSHVFGYWHIVPIVKNNQRVQRHQLLGYVCKGWEHVHFAERRGGVYLNPLRNGGIGPYTDRTAPRVTSVSLDGSTLVAVAYDTPDPRVPGAWANEPVTPALLRWRIAGGVWRTALDSRRAMLDNSLFAQIYSPATRQNHKGRPGVFSFYLQRSWSCRALSSGAVTIEVEASDTAGNRTVTAAILTPAV